MNLLSRNTTASGASCIRRSPRSGVEYVRLFIQHTEAAFATSCFSFNLIFADSDQRFLELQKKPKPKVGTLGASLPNRRLCEKLQS